LDLKLFDSKVSIVTDYFHGKDLLIQNIPVSGIVGIMLQEICSYCNAEGTVKIQVLNFR
jgi:hypothetical protein